MIACCIDRIEDIRPCFEESGREKIFETEEKDCLQPLPERPFTAITWKKIEVSSDGIVRVRDNYYGVPTGFAKLKVPVRISDDLIEVYTKDEGQCIARYERHEDAFETFDGLPGVCPTVFASLTTEPMRIDGRLCSTNGMKKGTAILIRTR